MRKVFQDWEGGRRLEIATGWQQATLDLGTLSAGSHTLTLGGTNNKKTLDDEETEILFDDVELVTVGSVGGGDPNTVWLHKDHLGSIQAATDGDGAAALRRGYAPYGAQLWATAATFTEAKNFIGERLDEETGLLYLNARYYDPVMGQFLSADPSDPLQPGVGVNRYAYAGGNPVFYSDPYGLRFDDDYSAKGESDPSFGADYSKAERGWFDRGLDYLDRVIQGAIGSPLTTRQAAHLLGPETYDSIFGTVQYDQLSFAFEENDIFIQVAFTIDAVPADFGYPITTVQVEDPRAHVVRMQAQGLGLEASVVLHGSEPITVSRALEALEQLKNELSRSELQQRVNSFVRAERFIRSGPQSGGIAPPGNSFPNTPGTPARVDVEILKGINFQE